MKIQYDNFDEALEYILSPEPDTASGQTIRFRASPETKEAIKKAVEEYVLPKIIHTLPEIAKANEHLDTRLQQDAYSKSEGFIDAVEKSKSRLWEK